jgi:opacity protein-like surface antigen
MGSTAVAADNGWYVEGQYLSIGDSDVDVGGIGVAIGNNVHENVAVEVIVGTGVGDDSYDGVDVELDSYYGLVVKPNMDVGDRANIFLNIGYVDVDVSASGFGVSASASSDEFLWGLGAQIDFTEQMYGTVSFIDIDETDGFKISVGYSF